MNRRRGMHWCYLYWACGSWNFSFFLATLEFSHDCRAQEQLLGGTSSWLASYFSQRKYLLPETSLGLLCIWPKPLVAAQPEWLPFAHCSQTFSLDIKPVSFLGGERLWREPFTSGSLAEIWPWLVVTENHYQLTATWWNELVSLIPAPNGYISVNTVTAGTNWHSPRDQELNGEGNWTFLVVPCLGFWSIMDRHFIAPLCHRLFLL